MTTSELTALKAKAEALFKRQASGEGGDKQQPREAVADAQTEKTAKLRALRLAKEESDRIAAELRRARREQQRL